MSGRLLRTRHTPRIDKERSNDQHHDPQEGHNQSRTVPSLSAQLLHTMDGYWRASNYLSVGQIYLYDSPLLKRPLALSDVRTRYGPVTSGCGRPRPIR